MHATAIYITTAARKTARNPNAPPINPPTAGPKLAPSRSEPWWMLIIRPRFSSLEMSASVVIAALVIGKVGGRRVEILLILRVLKARRVV
jgi:hypothetical protein